MGSGKLGTMNPAKKLGIYGQYGSIEAGKKADVVLLDEELALKLVIKDGKVIGTGSVSAD